MGSVRSDDVRQGTAAPFVRFLGSFEIVLPGDNPVELDSARARSLLAYLILHRSAPVERQRFVHALAGLPGGAGTNRSARTPLTRFKELEGLNRSDALKPIQCRANARR